MKQEDLVGKKVLVRDVVVFEFDNGMVVEKVRDVTGILDKVGSNKFFDWDLSVVLDGKAYKIKTLKQIEVVN
jgi:hypothetical protein